MPRPGTRPCPNGPGATRPSDAGNGGQAPRLPHPIRLMSGRPRLPRLAFGGEAKVTAQIWGNWLMGGLVVVAFVLAVAGRYPGHRGLPRP